MSKFALDNVWVDNFWNKIEKKLSVTAPEIGSTFPYTTKDKKYEGFRKDDDICSWTNGFWPGMMWLMYVATKDEKYKKIAEGCEDELDKAFIDFEGLHHDVGFMWLTSAVANYRLTGNEKSKNRGLHAATLLAGRFNTNGNFLRAWNWNFIGRGIIDSMMNIPLLYWASETLNDPRFKRIGMSHADTAMTKFVRPDGSSNHIVDFDPYTGEVLDTPEGQGYANGSSWSRGQGWALYGFTLSYIHTKKQEYLDTAKRVAHYFISNIDETGLPDVDFRSPDEPEMKDSTAGAIAACGLIELAKIVPEFEKTMYLRAAVKLLKGLESHCDFTLDEPSILQKGTVAYHDKGGIHIPIIYGDYYLMEALLKLKGNEILFW